MIKITSPIDQLTKCKVCGVEFSFNVTDVRLGVQMNNFGNMYEAPYVFCPVCDRAVYVEIK